MCKQRQSIGTGRIRQARDDRGPDFPCRLVKRRIGSVSDTSPTKIDRFCREHFCWLHDRSGIRRALRQPLSGDGSFLDLMPFWHWSYVFMAERKRTTPTPRTRLADRQCANLDEAVVLELQEIVKRFSGRQRDWIKSLGLDEDDFVQETIVHLLQVYSVDDPPSRLVAWGMEVARNRLIDAQRRIARQPPTQSLDLSDPEDDDPDEENDIPGKPHCRDDDREVYDAVASAGTGNLTGEAVAFEMGLAKEVDAIESISCRVVFKLVYGFPPRRPLLDVDEIEWLRLQREEAIEKTILALADFEQSKLNRAREVAEERGAKDEERKMREFIRRVRSQRDERRDGDTNQPNTQGKDLENAEACQKTSVQNDLPDERTANKNSGDSQRRGVAGPARVSTQDVAELTGLSANRIDQALSRARKSLQKQSAAHAARVSDND